MTQAPEQSTAKGWRPDDSTFGARLALIRQRMGWGNVREAAVACGIPPESWRTWERDNVAPRRLVEMAGLIADRTGCDFGWLIAGPEMASRSVKQPFLSDADHPTISSERRTPASPVRQPRTDSRRPVSAIPATRRRPQAVLRPGNRPKAA